MLIVGGSLVKGCVMHGTFQLYGGCNVPKLTQPYTIVNELPSSGLDIFSNEIRGLTSKGVHFIYIFNVQRNDFFFGKNNQLRC